MISVVNSSLSSLNVTLINKLAIPSKYKAKKWPHLLYKIYIFNNPIVFSSKSWMILLEATWTSLHCVKSVQIRKFFWSVFFCIWTKYGDLLSVFGHFSRSVTGRHHFIVFRIFFLLACSYIDICTLEFRIA